MSRSLKRKLDKHAGERADIEYGRYVRPLGDLGLHVVQFTSSTTEVVVGSTLGRKTFAPGTMVPLGSAQGEQRKLIIGEPPPGRRGGSKFSLFNPGPGALDAAGIVSWTPLVGFVGVSNQAVSVTGYGFESGDTWRYVVYNSTSKAWDADPNRTVHDVVVNSSTSVDLQLDIAASEPAGTIGWLEVKR